MLLIRLNDSQRTLITSIINATAMLDNICIISFLGEAISNDEARLFAEALRYNKSLKVLDLDAVKIEDEGLKAIAEAIKRNSSLITIRFSIRLNYLTIIADAVKLNQSIKLLEIKANNIDGVDAEAIEEMLNINTTLTTLSLELNNSANEILKHIAKSLENNNKSLTTLLIDCTTVDENNYSLFESVLEKNYTLSNFVVMVKLQNKVIEWSNVKDYIDRNKSFLIRVADALQKRTTNQSILHAYWQTFRYVIRDYWCSKLKDQEADEIIKYAYENYSVFKAGFGNLTKTVPKELTSGEVTLPSDMVKQILNEYLGTGHRAMTETVKRAQKKSEKILVA